MLTDANFKTYSYSREQIEEMINTDNPVSQRCTFVDSKDLRISEGIYYSGLNIRNDLANSVVKTVDENAIWSQMSKMSSEEFQKLHLEALGGDFEFYGVCDHHEQILKKYPFIEENDIPYLICLYPVIRRNEEYGGWRFRKWGDYIGDFDIQNEYISDEEPIHHVFVYRIFVLKK